MQASYLNVIVMLHAAFAAVFFFLYRQTSSAFAWRFALSWTIEGIRAAILIPGVRQLAGSESGWFCSSDVLCFLATWYLFTGCADLAGKRHPRWLGPVYLLTGIPLVVFNRFALPPVLNAVWGIPLEDGMFRGVLSNLVIMFEPVAAARLIVTAWLFGIWKKTRLPGAFFAGVFCIPYAIFALGVPIQFIFNYQPDWVAVVWCVRVLGFSIGLVMLMLSLQHAVAVKSAASLAAAQSLAKIGSWEFDYATGVCTWSAEMFRLYGRDPAEGVLTHEAFLATIHPDDRNAFQQDQALAVADRRSSPHQFRIVRADGQTRWIQGRNTPTYDQAGRLIRMVGVEQDITDRKRAESRMELQHSVTRAIAEADAVAPTLLRILAILGRGLEFNFGVFWSVDRGTNTLRCEQIWESASNGWPDLVAVTRDAVLKRGSERPGQVLASRESVFWSEGWEIEKTARSRTAERAGLQGGSAFPVLLRSEVVGVLEFFSVRPRARDDDICALYLAIGTQLGQCIERQRLHEQYRQSQKMEAVGTLAGGIAHDFNNILTAISGYCELARLESSPDAPILSHLEAVQQGATRATKLVRQILAFSRRQEHCRRPLELKAAVVEAISLLRATIPSTIEIKTSFGEDVSRILADPTSIHQVLVNLGTNASHAMKGRSGRLDIGVENVAVTAEFAESHPGLKTGQYVRMVVADTGHGMSAATISRIFEPFFTTKAPGEGTGLGLSVVHGIMQSHEGAIFVHSQTGEGTKFLLYFPAQCETSEPAPECAGGCVPIGERQRVLYVEDEGPLGDMGRKILERLNYVVDVHRSPSTALRAFRSNPEAYQVVITDLTMPEMTGLELARELLQLRPGLAVILMTGYAASLDAEQTKAEGLSELLLKPLSVEALGAAVHRALKSTPFAART